MSDPLSSSLLALGWNARVASAWATLGLPHAHPARVTAVQRSGPTVDGGAGPRPAHAPAELVLAVGDWVALDAPSAAQPRILARLPCFGELARLTPDGSPQVLVRNVDLLILVMGLDGDWNPRRLERYLALAHQAGVAALIVLSKADVHADAGERAAALARRVGATVPVFALDTRRAECAAALAPWLTAGTTAVLLGSSGAGKSTLTNTLLGGARQATGAVRADDARGRHTTTARHLFALAGGACLIDTPGLRGLQLGVTADAVRASFTEVAALATQCRFRDCRHGQEPGCAVREAVDADRLANLHKLEREAARLAADPQALAAQKGRTKAQHRALRARLKDKGRT
jgi:ribosome biogenesis GTPase